MSFESEEDAITESYNNGEISLTDFNEQIRELYREHREMAEEAAQDAYDREMERW